MLDNRNAARLAGHRLYLTGRPCANGHDAPRYVSTGGCKECLRSARETDRQIAKEAYAAAVSGSRLFAYRLHPDDHAQALAFCQALDLQRGRLPQDQARDYGSAKANAIARPGPLVLPPAIAAARAIMDRSPEVFDQHAALPRYPGGRK